MKIILKLNIFLFFILAGHVNAQVICPGANKKANFWYFGVNAGINFNSGAAVAVTNGQLSTREGVATMSDDNGNLLFYTDGSTVWNKAHAIMATGLLGNSSSTQSAVVIPNPGHASKYYVFTADMINGPQGYRYSEIDMTLNGGLGGVIAATKNSLLYLYHTEKITATKHANGVDYWIVVHENNNSNFRAYQVSSSGISAPVISTAGSTTSFDVPGSNSIGYLKFNKGGDMLIDVYNGLNFSSEIFNFNNSTGVITGPSITLSPLSACYGAEFSDNGKYVYISELQRNGNLDPGFNGKGAISQYNIKAGNNAAINASRVELITSNTIGYGALQMGPDGKIYAAKENGYYGGVNFLGVINNPDAQGTLSHYVENGLSLGGKQTLIGLPNFIYSDYSKPTLDILGKDKVCVGDQETYTFVRSGNFNYQRAVQGSGSAVTWGDTTVTINFTQAGKDTIRIRTFPECSVTVADTLIVTIFPRPSLTLGADSTLCSNPFSYTLNAGSFNSYLWNMGTTTSTYTATTPGTYWVEVSNAQHCKNRDSIVLSYSVPPVINLKDTLICQHATLVLQPGSFAHYLWQDNSTQPTFTVLNSGTYTLQATDANGCTANKSVDITLVPIPVIHIGEDSTFCSNPFSYTLDAGSFSSYLWNTGTTTSTYTATTPGTYWVEVSNAQHCKNRDSIVLSYSIPIIDLKDTVICQHTTVLLQPGSFTHYLWQDNSIQPTFTALIPGTYTLQATDANGCTANKSIDITLVPPFDIDIPDRIHCLGTTEILDAGMGFNTYTWQDGSHHQTFTTANAGNYSVTVTRSCESAQDTVMISNYAVVPPTIFGLAPSYCVSHDDVILTATPTGGVFSGQGMTGSVLHIKSLSLGSTRVIYSYVDGNGCMNRDTASTLINEDCFFIPNLITPNNDGQNDVFEVIGIGNNYTLEIYNRWGDLIYRKENYDNSFNGEGESDGVYFFELTHPQKDKNHKGWVQIVDRR